MSKLLQSVDRALVLPNPEVLGHPADPVAAFTDSACLSNSAVASGLASVVDVLLQDSYLSKEWTTYHPHTPPPETVSLPLSGRSFIVLLLLCFILITIFTQFLTVWTLFTTLHFLLCIMSTPLTTILTCTV